MKGNPTKFTLEYFFSQIVEFRQMFGTKSFWARPIEQREQACFAIGYMFLNLMAEDGSPLAEKQNLHSSQVYDATMREYSSRESILMLSGKVPMCS
jgi:hypothetical protein